ncbi:pre-mRNA-splicing factor CWC22 homolog isoform X2 [Gigantopelta aegis]|uniref:pre-mRNA-splicing factor CWC22 homolog isoform X2 n=1 Tax=Gigantopelta aegis TaxID=1735272 RepID=UPI001B88AD34|nr:pre-mRNA-splicing factor CWC22 homolog isoform X2 [Gigantopelta aegis]
MSEKLPPLDLIPLPEDSKDGCSVPESEGDGETGDKSERKRHHTNDEIQSAEPGEKKKKLDAKVLLSSELEKQKQKAVEESESGNLGMQGDAVSSQDGVEASSSSSQTIVDELFQDFLAFKMQQDEKVKQLKQHSVKSAEVSQVAHSMEEMSKLLDQEINLLLSTKKPQQTGSDSPPYKEKKKKRHSEKKRDREHKHRNRDRSYDREDRRDRKHRRDENDGRDGDRKKRKECDKWDKHSERRRDRDSESKREKDSEKDKNKDSGMKKDKDLEREKNKDSGMKREKDLEREKNKDSGTKRDKDSDSNRDREVSKTSSGTRQNNDASSIDGCDHKKEIDSTTHQTSNDKMNKVKDSEAVNCADDNSSSPKAGLGFSLQKPEPSLVFETGNTNSVSADSKKLDGDNKAPVSVDTQKKPMGLKLAISQESTAWILSGQSHNYKKNKIMEEGEVSWSSSDSSSDKESESEESDDDELPDGIPNESGSLSDTDKESKSSKSKTKKKKKHKHKKKKKHKSKDKAKKDEKKDKLKEKKNDDKKHSRSRSGSPRKGHRSRSCSAGRKSRNKSRSRSPGHRSRTRSHDRRKDKHGYDEWDARSYGSKGERDHRRHRSRSRSRSRDRGRDRWYHHDTRSSREERDLRLKIDKAKLRKIAMANVLKKMQAGEEISGVDSVTMNMLKAGGKSVEELTEYCKKLAEREKCAYSSSESDAGQRSDSDDDSLIHHPFVIRDPASQPSIVLNIRNSKQLPVRTPQETVMESAQLRLQFPVSSGTSHRAKEGEWVPVPKTTAAAIAAPAAALVTAVAVGDIKVAEVSSVTTQSAIMPAPVAPPPPPPPVPASATTTAAVPAVETNNADKVFPDPPQKAIDIGSIISERLHAARKLASNPYDVQALTAMHHVQQKASRWAESKHLPGQFIGSTGVQTLTPQELAAGDKRSQPWARKIPITFCKETRAVCAQLC